MIKILICILTIVASLDAAIPATWKRVYLSTYPRSGNHWMRFLIEEATGVLTGSVFCDPDPQHEKEPFPWGGYAPKGGYEGTRRNPKHQDIIVIKSHFPLASEKFDQRKRIGVINVVRHPVDTFYSLYVYSFKGEPYNPAYPTERLLRNIKQWRDFQEYWNNQPDVVTIRYEDLYNDQFNTLKYALNKIGFNVTDEDIQRAVDRYPPEGALLKHIGHYTQFQLDLIKTDLHDLLEQFGYLL